jgi:hypothetical protein
MKKRNELKLSQDSMKEIMSKHFAGTVLDQPIKEVRSEGYGAHDFVIVFEEGENG